jgi:hypothetical protein
MFKVGDYVTLIVSFARLGSYNTNSRPEIPAGSVGMVTYKTMTRPFMVSFGNYGSIWVDPSKLREATLEESVMARLQQ